MATSKATSSKNAVSVIPADPCDLDFCIAKFAAVCCIVLRFFILNLNSGELLAAQGPFVAVRPPPSQRPNLEVRANPF